MKTRPFTPILVSLLICLIFSAHAQDKEKLKDDNRKLKEAYKLIHKSNDLYDSGKLGEADSLYREALNIYPVNINLVNGNLMTRKINNQDIKGGNKVVDYLFTVLDKYDQTLYLYNKSGNYEYSPINEYKANMLKERARLNSEVGDLQQAVNDYIALEKYRKLTIEEYANLASYAFDVSDLDLVKRVIDSIKHKQASGEKIPKHLLTHSQELDAQLAFAEGKLDIAERMALKLEQDKESNIYAKYNSRILLLLINVEKGNSVEARKYLEQMLKHVFITRKIPDINYWEGLIFLKEGKKEEALTSFNKAATYKPGFFGAYYTRKYRYYTGRALAYAALKDYNKAKSDYELSLLYNPNYEPAVEGLTQLEVAMAQEIKIDKEAPNIQLLEPSIQRGLKITSSKTTLFVKGIAKDVSGLKEVRVNNQVIYSQNNGDFWGEIPLAEGDAKVTIRAMDLAGNVGEMQFEVSKIQASGKAENAIVPVKSGKNYCLLIASQNYDDSSIPSLNNPIADAVKLKVLLKKDYNYLEENIVQLFNPSGSDIKKMLMELNGLLLPEDNLLIFYAGHGLWVEQEKKGYWLMTDSKLADKNTWLPNRVILDEIAKIQSRHTLLITDACFSGSVFKTRGINTSSEVAQEMENKITRVAITSGNDTEVPDESVFMKYLLKALSENKDKYLPSQKMFVNHILEAVITETKTEPRYGTLELAGHVGGDFVFNKK